MFIPNLVPLHKAEAKSRVSLPAFAPGFASSYGVPLPGRPLLFPASSLSCLAALPPECWACAAHGASGCK